MKRLRSNRRIELDLLQMQNAKHIRKTPAQTASKQPANRTRLATDAECETYPQNACANGVAYGCHKNKLYGGKGSCWSSCTTRVSGSVGYQWLTEEADGVIIKTKYLQCDPTKPADDLQCVGKADRSQSWVCINDVLGQI